MSTFGGLSTAYSGLVAARTGLDVTGQNIANAGTAGYTRQRVTQTAVPTVQVSGILLKNTLVGQGVSVDGIARLGNLRLDAQVRAATATGSWSSARADALSTLETGLNEPGTDGLSAKLDALWSSFQGLQNDPGGAAPASVVLTQAQDVAATLAAGSKSVDDQWASARQSVGQLADQLNQTAAQVADLNHRIRSTVAAGGSANELVDQRDQLATTVASLAGGSVRDNGDGTVDVVVGGNAIVQGDLARRVQVTGAATLRDAASDPVGLRWADGQQSAVALEGGSIAGTISVLAPANGSGTGGLLAEASATYDRIATTLAAQVNAIHEQGYTSTGATGADVFSFRAGVPAAQGLQVVPTDATGLATRSASGTLDGSFADRIAQLATAGTGADAAWSTFVTATGATSAAAARESNLADLALASATSKQQSEAGVDLDEENVNLLTYQHAYQGAARVLTAVDEMLDTLINHTGLVGR